MSKARARPMRNMSSRANLGDHRVVSISKDDAVDPLKEIYGLSTCNCFLAFAFLSLFLYEWSFWWWASGTPILTYFALYGAAEGVRIVPALPIWALLLIFHLAYGIAATSWLLYRVYAVLAYELIFLVAIFQFKGFSALIRGRLRKVLRQLQFHNDKIAFFDIPALEIDTEVDGLFVVRGLSLSLTSLTIVVHGVEVAVKLSDDMELSLGVEKVVVKLFRKVEVGAVFGNLKGGEYEMTFGKLEESSKDDEGNALMHSDSALLKTARAGVERQSTSATNMTTMKEHMTNGQQMEDSSAKAAAKSIETLSPDDEHAREQYRSTLNWIKETNTIHQCREKIRKNVRENDEDTYDFDDIDAKQDAVDMKAAICTRLHNKPSIGNPPARSIRVTTLQNMLPKAVQEFLHRCPMLLRLLVNPLAYFHPVQIESVTVAASGKWVQSMLDTKVFRDYQSNDMELRRLYKNISSWMSEANFVVHLGDFSGFSQVPFIPTYDILCQILISDVVIFRTEPNERDLKEVVRLGGADAIFCIPYHLMPHHEHLIPPKPDKKDREELEHQVDEAEGKPKTLIKKRELAQAEKDESNVNMSVHGKLPLTLDQELLNFVMALVKATQVIEVVKSPGLLQKDINSLKDLTSGINQSMKDGMKKIAIEGMMNDAWLAKIAGKIARNLEKAHGDIGYSGDIPVALKDYRPRNEAKEPTKLMP